MTPNNPHNTSILKETRLAKGLTLDLVHEATKIPLDALKAIEEGYSVRMLTPFYYKGFIKIYAEFLGLDVKEVFAKYNLTAAAVKPHVPVGKILDKPNGPNAIGIALKNTLTPKNLLLVLRVIGIIVLIWLVLKISGCAVNMIKSWPKAQTKKAQEHRPKTEAKPITVKKEVKEVKEKENKDSRESKEQKKEVEQKAQNEENNAPVKVQEPAKVERVIGATNDQQVVQLAVRATRDSWIQVKADNKVVFQMTMKKGTMENWDAKSQIELTGKNINELEMEVNGKHIGALGSAERKAKKVIITKEGLTVKK